MMDCQRCGMMHADGVLHECVQLLPQFPSDEYMAMFMSSGEIERAAFIKWERSIVRAIRRVFTPGRGIYETTNAIDGYRELIGRLEAVMGERRESGERYLGVLNQYVPSLISEIGYLTGARDRYQAADIEGEVRGLHERIDSVTDEHVHRMTVEPKSLSITSMEME